MSEVFMVLTSWRRTMWHQIAYTLHSTSLPLPRDLLPGHPEWLATRTCGPGPWHSAFT